MYLWFLRITTSDTNATPNTMSKVYRLKPSEDEMQVRGMIVATGDWELSNKLV